MTGVEGVDVCGGEFEVVVYWDEELRYSTVVLDKVGRDSVQINGLEIMLLNETGDLVFKVTDLETMGIVVSIDGTDKPYDDAAEVASRDVTTKTEVLRRHAASVAR